MKDLYQSFVTGGGKINPGGYIRILSVHVDIPVLERRNVSGTGGLAIWHPELMPYGKTGGFKAVVTQQGHLSIRDAKGRFHAHIRNDDAISVNVHPGFVAANGYVGKTIGEGCSLIRPNTFDEMVASWENHTCVAIDRANANQHPGYVDNSPFTQVVDDFTVHQRVIVIDPSLSHQDGEYEMIFDLEGNRLASKTHYPLRVSKWDPRRDTARYSRSDEYIISAA